MINKIIACFMLLMLAARPSIAQNSEESFTAIEANQPTPYAGYLFKPEALAKIYATVEEDEAKLRLEHKLELDKLNLEIGRINKLMSAEITAREDLIEKIITSKNSTIADLNKEIVATKWFTAGAFVAGVLITGASIYFISGMVK